jgi:hypothetical protein
MLKKIIDLGDAFEFTGEPTVQELHKRASDDKSVEQHFQVRNPDPRYVYLHVIAMGAGDYYGPNSRGDYFPERELIGACEKVNGKLRCYGFHTFEEKAKVYREHRLPPEGDVYGDVLKAHYNQKMHRVELLIAIDKEKAPDLVRKIENGEPLKFSMGANVAYDECSICGNRAYKSTAEYCKHGKYELNRVYPDGRKVYRINYKPEFYDISVVRKPADSIAYQLRKVASEDGDLTERPWLVVAEVARELGMKKEASFLELADELGLDFEEAVQDAERMAKTAGMDWESLAKAVIVALLTQKVLSLLTGKFQEGYMSPQIPVEQQKDRIVFLPGYPYRVKPDGSVEPAT